MGQRQGGLTISMYSHMHGLGSGLLISLGALEAAASALLLIVPFSASSGIISAMSPMARPRIWAC